jgi:hypothetical protein
MDLYCPDIIDERWTRRFNYNHLPQFPVTPNKVTVMNTPRKRILGLAEKYKKLSIVTQKLSSNIANM